MSYDISLLDPVTEETIFFDEPHQIKGGTYAIGGTSEAWLNITYNYSQWYYKDGVSRLMARKRKESAPSTE